MKNIPNIKASSVLSIFTVNFGGIKKKFHIKALSEEARVIGPIPINIARMDTTNSRINETD
jgi:hypothetical protein